MVARVPTPGSTGLGSAPLAEIRTPYSDLKAPKEAFGDGGALAAKAAEGLASFSDEMTSLALSEDDRAVKAAEAEIDTYLASDTQKFKALSGQQRLDALTPKGHPGQVDQGDKATAIADGGIEAILKKHGVQTSDGAKAIRDMARIKSLEHNITLNGLQIEAQKQADITEQGTAIASHTEAATAAIGTEMQGQKLKDALNGISSVVTSKRFGMAKTSGITDPAAVEVLKKQQQAILLDQYIGDLLAQGYVEDARSVMKEHADILDGTEAGRKHQAAVLGFEQEQASRAEFDTLRVESKDNVVTMYDTIYRKYADDPIKQGNMLQQLRLYTGVLAAQRGETVRVASEDLSRMMGQGVPANDPKFRAKLAIVASSSPEALMQVLRLPGKAADIGAQTVAAQAHMDSGGAAASVVAAKRAYDRLYENAPDQLTKMVETEEGRATLRRVLDVDDYNEVLNKVEKHRSKVLNIRTGNTKGYNVSTLLKSYGFKTDDKYYNKLLVDTELQKAINNVRADIFEKTGKDVTDADIVPILAEHVLRLDDYDTGKTVGFMSVTQSGPYTLTQAEQDGANIGSLPISDSGVNRSILQSYFGVDDATIKDAISKLDSQNKLLTLDNLRATGLTVRRGESWSAAYRGYTDAQDAALANGYSPEVIEFIIKKSQASQPNLRPDLAGFNHVMSDLNRRANEGVYEEWLRRFMAERR